MNRISVVDWCKAFQDGKFSTHQSQPTAGWYDWFCQDYQLVGRLRRLGRIVCKIKDGGKVDRSLCYVWFKNNCPASDHPLYDDFRFAVAGEPTPRFTVACLDHRNNHRYVVYGVDPFGVGHWGSLNEAFPQQSDGDCLYAADTVAALVGWFNRPWFMEASLVQAFKKASTGASFQALEALLEYYVTALGWSRDAANQYLLYLLEKDAIRDAVVSFGKGEN